MKLYFSHVWFISFSYLAKVSSKRLCVHNLTTWISRYGEIPVPCDYLQFEDHPECRASLHYNSFGIRVIYGGIGRLCLKYY